MPPHPRESERRARWANRLRAEVPPRPDTDRAPRPPRNLQVFGTGTDWVQLTWSALGPGAMTVRADGSSREFVADGGPGSLVLDRLPAGAAITLEVSGAGIGSPIRMPAALLEPPPGLLLSRLATVSDSHIGSASTGYLHTIIEKPEPAVPHPDRCLRTAIDEAAAWGATELLVKGDLVDRSAPANWAAAEAALATFPGQVSIVAGNHEWSPRGDGRAQVGLAATGHRVVWDVAHHDVEGVRVILADTAVAGRDRGTLSAATASAVMAAAGETELPVLVGIHHQLMRVRFPTSLPIGVPGPEARAFLRGLGRANRRALVTSGHTHRHRRRRAGPVTVTEVGSTKDFPGTWAGYEIYEGGIVQIVRRIAEPSCIRWTDWTRRAAGGVWQLWSPGRLSDRCFTRTW